MKPMKILVIGSDEKILEKGSLPRERQIKYFSAFESALFVSIREGEEYNSSEGNLRFIRRPAKGKLSQFFKTLFFILKETKENKYNLITTQDVLLAGLCGFIVSRIRHIPIVVQLHGDYLDNPRWIGQQRIYVLFNIFGKYIVKRAEGVRAVSNRIVKEAIEKFGVKRENIVSIPIGTDMSLFTPNASELPNDIKNIIFVGRLIEEKEPFLFVSVSISLLKKYEDVRILIAGEGNLKQVMEEMYKKENLLHKVNFLGQLNAMGLAENYRKSYLNLHTASWEGWGMPMIEGMACGAPVVTTDSGCAGEAVMDNVNGYVIPIKDEKGLIEKCGILLEDPNLRRKFSEASVVEAKNWSFASLSEKMIEFYKRCARK